MKRSTLAALLACAGLSGACSDSEVVVGVAGLSGTYDVTYANGSVFVTSSDRVELRVLDLVSEPRQFIPAPNPLEALAIPVLERPDDLTSDEDFGASGEAGVPYIYARSSGSQRISVVAAQRERLNTVRTLDAGGLVTAFAARAPSATRANSVLYYALQTPPPGSNPLGCAFGTIMRRELPGPDALASAEPPEAVPVFCLFERESAITMAVMPEEGRLVVGTRSTTRLPPALPGRTLVITETVGGGTPREPVDLSAGFEGSPVRLVATHPQVNLVNDDPATPGVDETQVLFTPGQYVFGLRDESACGGAPQCSGVLAVDAATGARANDLGGAPMFAINTGTGLPTGMALVKDAGVLLRNATGLDVARVPLLGILPSSNGSITLFSASDRRHFDVEPALPNVVVTLRDVTDAVVDRGVDTTRASGVVVVEQPVESVNPTSPGRRTTLRRTLFEGSVPDATFRIIYQGIFPTMARLSRDLSNPTFFEVDQPDDPRKQVAAGDVIILESDDAFCATDLVVRAVVPTTAGRVRLEINNAIPDVCAGLPLFSVLAAGSEPLMLVDGGGNLLARDLAGNAAGYGIPTGYYFHPIGFQSGEIDVDDAPGQDADPATDDAPWKTAAFPKPPPDLVVRVESNPAARLIRGDRFLVEVTSGVSNFVFGVDTETTNSLALYTLPGPVVAPPGGDLAYIAYPSADGVLQVNMSILVDNVPNTTALNPFE